VAINAEALSPHSQTGPDASAIELRHRDQRFEAFALGDIADGSLSAVILLDDLTLDRLTALARFWATLRGQTIPSDPRMTPQRKQRARQMLRVVDGRTRGATYRAIADAVFPKHGHDAASWVGSSIRETTIRLARDGLQLVRGGYRSLLRRPRRNR
jgi:hypothetical protein